MPDLKCQFTRAGKGKGTRQLNDVVGFLDKKADSEHHEENSPFRQNPENTAPETQTPLLEISPTLETRKTSETGPLPPPYPPLATPMPSAGLSVPTGNTRIPGQPRPAQCGWVKGGSGRGDAGRPAMPASPAALARPALVTAAPRNAGGRGRVGLADA